MNTLLINPTVLSLEKIVPHTDAIIMVATASRTQATCPECRQLSPRVHSRYHRSVTDLPWGEITNRLELHTRKFFCDNDECQQRIFCERLPEVVMPYGRRTIRFNKSLTAVGFALRGRAGERLASELYLSSGARTLLRRIYDEHVGNVEPVRKRMPKKPPAPSQQREQNRAERMARYAECRRLKRLGLSNREIARRTGIA